MSEEFSAAKLEQIYDRRFESNKEYRNRVWQVLAKDFFQKYVAPNHTVLDLGCGYGEFINNIHCAKKYAMDLNPRSSEHLNADVQLLQQDCSSPWNLPNHSLDIVFTSNFFEHLPSKDALSQTLEHAAAALRVGGLLIAVGPNIGVLNGRYWDFWDHQLALTDRSLVEALGLHGFSMREVYPSFLPFTLVGAVEYPIWTLKIYLRLPMFWRFFGGQFLVMAVR